MTIEARDISISFDGKSVLDSFSASFAAGTVTAILGPSGCGKTSLLRVLSGLAPGDAGTVSGIDPESLSFVFQEPRLLPWLDILSNVSLPLARLMEKGDADKKARRSLSLVDLHGDIRAKPATLSGGMKQRAALARALAYPCRCMFMDEPFQALDISLKADILSRVADFLGESPRTVILVTHDVQEALFIADRIIVLGSSPAKIIDDRRVPGERGHRDLSSGDFASLSAELFRTMRDDRDRVARFRGETSGN